VGSGDPTVPDDVYRAAAKAYVTTGGANLAPGTLRALVALRLRDPEFRAAVEVAWRAGRENCEPCDDKLTGLFGEPNHFCELPYGHRGAHREETVTWRRQAP
jgi:hypothetical protein